MIILLWARYNTLFPSRPFNLQALGMLLCLCNPDALYTLHSNYLPFDNFIAVSLKLIPSPFLPVFLKTSILLAIFSSISVFLFIFL